MYTNLQGLCLCWNAVVFGFGGGCGFYKRFFEVVLVLWLTVPKGLLVGRRGEKISRLVSTGGIVEVVNAIAWCHLQIRHSGRLWTGLGSRCVEVERSCQN